jgi:hypothetical protein
MRRLLDPLRRLGDGALRFGAAACPGGHVAEGVYGAVDALRV